MGDLIEMPEMKGKEVLLPNGRKMIHPGFFRVEDRGSEILGVGRFDFFTGRLSPRSPRNSFHRAGRVETQMLDPKDCSERKRYRRIRPGAPEYANAIAEINRSLQAAGLPPLPPMPERLSRSQRGLSQSSRDQRGQERRGPRAQQSRRGAR